MTTSHALATSPRSECTREVRADLLPRRTCILTPHIVNCRVGPVSYSCTAIECTAHAPGVCALPPTGHPFVSNTCPCPPLLRLVPRNGIQTSTELMQPSRLLHARWLSRILLPSLLPSLLLLLLPSRLPSRRRRRRRLHTRRRPPHCHGGGVIELKRHPLPQVEGKLRRGRALQGKTRRGHCRVGCSDGRPRAARRAAVRHDVLGQSKQPRTL